jgi:hypothetical protein
MTEQHSVKEAGPWGPEVMWSCGEERAPSLDLHTLKQPKT